MVDKVRENVKIIELVRFIATLSLLNYEGSEPRDENENEPTLIENNNKY